MRLTKERFDYRGHGVKRNLSRVAIVALWLALFSIAFIYQGVFAHHDGPRCVQPFIGPTYLCGTER